MQTILGAGGAIGKDLAKELLRYSSDIRLVGRNPERVNPTDELFPADLNDPEEVDRAIEGSDIVYSVIGFKYSTRVWQKQWPVYMDSVIKACIKYNTSLVFFDNIYMYDPDYLNGMDENTPMRPVSKKGEVRLHLVEKIQAGINSGNLNALIARAPDFLGDHNSVIYEMVIKNMKAGKKAMWFSGLDRIHNFIYTPDAAKATAMLGNTKDAYGQTWHLPVDQTPYTGQNWINMVAEITGSKASARIIKPATLSMLGIVMPVMHEMKEMIYQYERDYLFSSRKFEEKFKFRPTPAKEALRKVVGQ